MPLPSKLSTSDFNLQGRDNVVIEYDWSEVIEYTRSKFAGDFAGDSTAAAVSPLEPQVTPNIDRQTKAIAEFDRASFQDRISLRLQ
jgi:hypothetical protein